MVEEIYMDFAKDFVKQAGIIAKKYFLQDTTQWKKDQTPVTEADLAINTLLIKTVNTLFPGHRVIGEEESTTNESDYCRVCDPIDWTIPYSHGVPVSSVCLSLLYKWESMLWIIYDPFLDRMFWSDGLHAYMNDELIHVNSETDPNKMMIAIECFPRAAYDFTALQAELIKMNIKVVQFASIAYPTALVAAWMFTATIHPANPIWEFAAAKPIVTCAGGKVTDLMGKPQNYLGEIHWHISSNGAVHDFLVDLIAKTVDLTHPRS